MYKRQQIEKTFKAPKKLVAKRFHASKPEFTSEEEPRETEVKVAKPSVYTLEDHKQQLKAWIETEHIPGKFQAWFSLDANPINSDWRIKSVKKGMQNLLEIEAPVRGMEPPKFIQDILEQLHKEHLKTFCKSIRQIWFRATGDGNFAILIQANFRSKTSAHAGNTFVDFVQRSCPNILSLHYIQCKPDYLFDPAAIQNMHTEARSEFGSDFMPIAGTGFSMHVLDWAPRVKDSWIKLPQRIKEAIHPAKGDKLFEFYSASAYIGASLANEFEKVECLDCRESAMLSTRYNSKKLLDGNLRFHRQKLDVSIFEKFFSKSQNDGRWTFYFNLPGEEPLPAGVSQAAAQSRPERILLQTSNLEIALKEIRKFRNEGYVLRKSVPLYLEPGSSKFEVLFIFVPDRNGLLGHNPANFAKSRNIQKPKERLFDAKQSNIPHFVQNKPTFKQRKD